MRSPNRDVQASKELWTNVLQYAPGALVPALFALLNSIIFTRLFRTGEYGQFSLVSSVVALAAAVTTQSLQQGIGRFLPGSTDPAAIDDIKAATGLGLTSAVAGSCLLLGPAILWWPRYTGSEWRDLAWAGWALFIATVLSAPLATVLQSEMRAKRHTAYNVATVVIRFVVSLALVFLYRRDPSSLLIAAAITQGLVGVLMWRDAGIPVRRITGARPAAALKKMLAYGLPMIGFFVAATLLSVGDRYVIQYFRGEAEVGIYSANYNLITWAVGLITSPVLLASHPLLMSAWAAGDRQSTAKWLGIITETFLSAGVVLVGAAFVFSKDVAILALGRDFRAGHHVMPIVLAGVVAWQLAMYTHKPLEFVGRTKAILVLSVGSAALNVAANVWLVPQFGYTAAAYTTLACYLLYAISAGVIGRRVIAWTVDRRRVIASVTVTAAGCGCTIVARAWLHERFGYVPGLLGGMVGVSATAALVLRRAVRTFALSVGKSAAVNGSLSSVL